MITREEIIEYALTLPDTASDQPFSENFDTTILRHSSNGKWFGALLYAPWRRLGVDREGYADVLNLKCDPLLSYGLIQSYAGVLPGYHMNKHHWITVILDGDVPFEAVRELICMSHELTGHPPRKVAKKPKPV